jgi:hypothetical protein
LKRWPFVDGGAVAGDAAQDLVGGLGPHEGLGFWFQVSTQSVMSAAKALTERCAERWNFLVARAENQRSTRFIHDP